MRYAKFTRVPLLVMTLITTACVPTSEIGMYTSALFSTSPIPPETITAAEHGDAKTQYALGWWNTTDPAGDVTVGTQWFRKAAEQGYDVAQFMLANAYDKGLGVTMDHNEAAKWYRKAAEQNDTASQYRLAYMYAEGVGVARNDEEALKWMRKAESAPKLFDQLKRKEEPGSAEYSLGMVFEIGNQVTKNEVMSAKWYRKAAELGNAEAQYALGMMYIQGRGVAKDKAEAINWLGKAANQGFAKANKALKQLEQLEH